MPRQAAQLVLPTMYLWETVLTSTAGLRWWALASLPRCGGTCWSWVWSQSGSKTRHLNSLQLIHTLIWFRGSGEDGTQNIVEGKSCRTIILLHGPSEEEKALMVEAIA